MFSTIAMVQLGKTYGNLMVDLNPSNIKLRERATGIVSAIAGVGHEQARECLELNGFNVKLAILVLRGGMSVEVAAARLDRVDGHLRAALEDAI
jgi:N-acetylmuramic acid 6-phosphate etherase